MFSIRLLFFGVLATLIASGYGYFKYTMYEQYQKVNTHNLRTLIQDMNTTNRNKLFEEVQKQKKKDMQNESKHYKRTDIRNSAGDYNITI